METIRLQNECLEAVLLPGLGGKVASLRRRENGFEAAAQSAVPYRPAYFGAPFAEFDASGLDDAFPCIDPSVRTADGREYVYPDHGEIWSAAFSHTSDAVGAHLVYESGHLPYRYEKDVHLWGDALVTDIRITLADGAPPFPCLWTYHGLMRYEEDMRVEFPAGDILPLCGIGEGEAYDVTRVPPRNSGAAVKYYASEPVKEGRCGLLYPSQGMACRLEYDAEKLPYLGFWVTAGGFRGDYNCALEPSNGFYDGIDTAEKNGRLPLLTKETPLSFRLSVRLCPLTE